MRKGTVCSWIWHGVGRDSTNFSDGQGMPGGPVTIAPHSWLTAFWSILILWLKCCLCVQVWTNWTGNLSLCAFHIQPQPLYTSLVLLCFQKTYGLSCSPGQLVIRDKTTCQVWLSEFSWRHSHSFPPFALVFVSLWPRSPPSNCPLPFMPELLPSPSSPKKNQKKKQYLSKPTFFGASKEHLQPCDNLDSLV